MMDIAWEALRLSGAVVVGVLAIAFASVAKELFLRGPQMIAMERWRRQFRTQSGGQK